MNDQSLRNALHLEGLSNTDRLLVVLLASEATPLEVREIREQAVSHGLRKVKNWNISQLLGAAKGKAIRVTGGWELTPGGVQHLAPLGIALDDTPAKQAKTLRKLLPKISTEKNRDFVAEAVSCYERKNLRAAAVLSWVGAVSILYDYVMQNELTRFNTEWLRRNSRNRQITAVEGLSDIKEDTFLDILHAISVIGKSVKDELKGCLKFRNGCGHPNTLEVGETRVAAHLETLINNVYKKF